MRRAVSVLSLCLAVGPAATACRGEPAPRDHRLRLRPGSRPRARGDRGGEADPRQLRLRQRPRAGEWSRAAPHDADNLKVLTGLRRDHPHFKVLVSVGGWTWSKGFSDAALTPKSRRVFVASAVDFVRRHDLDGFDVDWEYPGLPGDGNPHRPEDKENFTALMAELRAALDGEGARRGRHLLLTFAAGASSGLPRPHRDGEGPGRRRLRQPHDLRLPGGGTGEEPAGHHANLYPSPADPGQRSADGAVRDFLAAGVPASKLVLGVPFYGRAWEGVGSREGLYREGRPPAERIDTSHAALAALGGPRGMGARVGRGGPGALPLERRRGGSS